MMILNKYQKKKKKEKKERKERKKKRTTSNWTSCVSFSCLIKFFENSLFEKHMWHRFPSHLGMS